MREGSEKLTDAQQAEKAALEALSDARYRAAMITKGYTEAEADLLTQHRLATDATRRRLLIEHRERTQRETAEAKAKKQAQDAEAALKRRTAATNEALAAAKRLRAANQDLARSIATGRPVENRAARQVPYPDADPAARRLFQSEQAESDRLKRRAAELNAIRQEAMREEKKLREARGDSRVSTPARQRWTRRRPRFSAGSSTLGPRTPNGR